MSRGGCSKLPISPGGSPACAQSLFWSCAPVSVKYGYFACMDGTYPAFTHGLIRIGTLQRRPGRRSPWKPGVNRIPLVSGHKDIVE
eukprot:gene5405-biopygen1691